MHTQPASPRARRCWPHLLHLRWMMPLLWLAIPLFAVLGLARPALAQAPDCDVITEQIEGALAPGVCQTMPQGSACLASTRVTAQPRSGATLKFTVKGDQVALGAINAMTTLPQQGAAILLGGTAQNPVKILVFGDATTQPSLNLAGRVFTLRTRNGQPACTATRSGMILQTPTGKRGQISVNGVTIQLGSTAYIVPGADLMFDQDPRLDRRQGRRNPGAPLCSGFDSDCDFGDEQCRPNQRLVWGPYCREDAYPYIGRGLYRVTLYGQGRVLAGATDYNLEKSYDLFGSQEFDLPGSYTFCWDGLAPGGSGFETIVQPRSNDARVDHLTLEYLGRDCAMNGDAVASGLGPMGIMSVYNVDGNVGVDLANGSSGDPGTGQRMRVYYEDGQPVALDAVATDAPVVMGSDLVQWAEGATGSGLPEIQIGRAPPPLSTPVTPGSNAPVVKLSVAVLDDDGAPFALRIEATAYDPGVGNGNGDGISQVSFTVRDPNGQAIHRRDEATPAYCAFGGNDSPCPAASFNSDGGLDLGSEPLSGDYTVEATALADSGERTTARTRFTLDFGGGGDTQGPDISQVQVSLGGASKVAPKVACAGGDVFVSAQVVDGASGVDQVQLWSRMVTDGSTSFEPATMGRDGDTYYGAIQKVSGDAVAFYITARDTAGNESATGIRQLPIVYCIE